MGTFYLWTTEGGLTGKSDLTLVDDAEEKDP